jgi:hypothetical protein
MMGRKTIHRILIGISPKRMEPIGVIKKHVPSSISLSADDTNCHQIIFADEFNQNYFVII